MRQKSHKNIDKFSSWNQLSPLKDMIRKNSKDFTNKKLELKNSISVENKKLQQIPSPRDENSAVAAKDQAAVAA